MMKTTHLMSITGLAILASITAEAADVRRGADLADRWCSQCHLTGTEQAAGQDAAPPFSQIARHAAERSGELKTWLADPHPPMPDLDLARRDIDDLLGYIESLRGQ